MSDSDWCPTCGAYGTMHCSTRTERDHKARWDGKYWQTIEGRALTYLRTEYNPDEGGWISEVDAQPHGMTIAQFRSALQRLREKGLAVCLTWHAGDFGERAIWFPERAPGYDPPKPVD